MISAGRYICLITSLDSSTGKSAPLMLDSSRTAPVTFQSDPKGLKGGLECHSGHLNSTTHKPN